MKKVIIFGNSGSGKSTLAKSLSQHHTLAHLDLDTLAWQPVSPPVRMPLEESARMLNAFTEEHASWVIEGCYADLINLLMPLANELIFLNLSTEQCVKHAKERPWEPHKYASKEAQDANLAMLLAWIEAYESRRDTCSKQAHMALYDAFDGHKTMYTRNADYALSE